MICSSSTVVIRLILDCLPTSGSNVLRLEFSKSRFNVICSARVDLLSSAEPKYRILEEDGMILLLRQAGGAIFILRVKAIREKCSLFIFVVLRVGQQRIKCSCECWPRQGVDYRPQSSLCGRIKI